MTMPRRPALLDGMARPARNTYMYVRHLLQALQVLE